MEPIIEDRVIPPGEVWARVVASGQVLRIVDLEGKQAVDFLCYHAPNPEERYNAADTMKYAGTIFLTRGHGIYSDMGRRLFAVIANCPQTRSPCNGFKPTPIRVMVRPPHAT